MLSKKSKGFTLIELLVVIAVIAILAGLVIIRISSASRDARNSRRVADMNQIRTAVEQFKAYGGACTTRPVQNSTKALLEPASATAAFSTADSKSSYPSAYLSGSEYPADPQSTTATPRYYQFTMTDGAKCQYTISRNTSVGDAPTATEVPDVQG